MPVSPRLQQGLLKGLQPQWRLLCPVLVGSYSVRGLSTPKWVSDSTVNIIVHITSDIKLLYTRKHTCNGAAAVEN